MVKFYVRRIYHNLKVFAKWAVFSSITGLVVGAFSTLFAECLKLVTQFRTANPWMILLLPLVGIVIVFLYHIFHYKNDKGTNMVLSTIHAETELPFKMAPLIFISTTLTHLFGGSAGREGAALQLGGSIGNQLGRWFRFDEKDRRIVGIVIVFLYHIFHYKNDKGTNMVLSTIHAETELPFKMAPLIFISTTLTHLFGGSAGREGAALQLGGSIGNQLGRWFRFDEKDRRIVVMCGMSAAFSAIFGTPIAAVVFAMEVVSVGVMYYAALVPCVFASLIASKFARHMGIGPDTFLIKKIPDFLIVPSIKVILLAVCCAAVSVIFCVTLHSLGDFYRDKLKNPYIRIVVSSLVIVALTMVLHTTDYMGAGVPIIERAIAGHVVPLAFVWKIIFTALTLEAGFKGGEIVPSFCVGAAFGCLFGQLIGLSPSLCAALGMVSVFCGVTNCPITSLLIAFELFGYHGIPFFMIAISVSYLLSGYYGLYHDQTIVYSKYKTEYINRKARD